jgi:hypothetical protein
VKRTSRNRGALHAPYGGAPAKSAAFRGFAFPANGPKTGLEIGQPIH